MKYLGLFEVGQRYDMLSSRTVSMEELVHVAEAGGGEKVMFPGLQQVMPQDVRRAHANHPICLLRCWRQSQGFVKHSSMVSRE